MLFLRTHWTGLHALLCAATAALPSLGIAGVPDEQSWDARFQTSYTWQKKPGFGAAYSGPNSLSPDKEISYTFTTTAFLGLRPWRDGEIYLNAEMGQGVPFSDLLGTAGFTNGEVTRVAGTNPKIYRQRLFLRQTWNLGGGAQRVESDFNQLAGEVDKNRLVLTVGNFSTLDVFDGNAYAHDPRRQFMNWAHMTSLAYDYAADARGYGWGVAGEWYQDDWTLRLGRMTGPLQPNMLPTDYNLYRHHGDQAEIEHRHEWNGQPGSVRLLTWRNRAILARYDDAIAYGNSVNWAPDPQYGRQYIFKVRNTEQIKYGLGVNADQALSDDLGVFVRAMWSDGKTETEAFTEADRSVAAGVSLKGTRWGRPQDTVGLALARNDLSADRRHYLENGGISFFIGDGALNYRPETTLEGYYSWNISKGVWLGADYQRIANPAYNAERGPVNVYGTRLHLEY